MRSVLMSLLEINCEKEGQGTLGSAGGHRAKEENMYGA